MKKFRQGFTLVELVIVIGIIGILSAMGMMSGSEVTAAASASKIIEEFKIASAAMNIYYANNKAKCDAGTVTVDNLLEGLKTYMKSTASLTKTAAPGKYLISFVKTGSGTANSGGEWWLSYTLPVGSTKIAKILENRAEQEGLYKTAAATTAEGTDNYYVNTGTLICYQAR